MQRQYHFCASWHRLAGGAATAGLALVLAACTDPPGRHHKPLTTGNLSTTEKARDCPDWRQPSTHNFYNYDHSNFGCATWGNMVKLVDNPRDLDHGRGRPHDSRGDTNTAAVDAYRASFSGSSEGGSESSGSSSGESAAAASSGSATSQ